MLLNPCRYIRREVAEVCLVLLLPQGPTAWQVFVCVQGLSALYGKMHKGPGVAILSPMH